MDKSNSVSSKYISAAHVWVLVHHGFFIVNPEDRLDVATNEMHVMVHHRHDDAHDPCNVLDTQS